MNVLHVGCGTRVIPGAINIDNSPAVIIGKLWGVQSVLRSFHLLNDAQNQYVDICKKNDIRHGDATKLRFENESFDVVYSSHMIEHLYEEDYIKFIKEAERILKKGGIFRIAIPDLRIFVEDYVKTGDADKFCERLLMGSKRRMRLSERIRYLFFGDRLHKWMYDGKSMKKFIEENSNFDVKILPVGETLIKGEHGIDLREKEIESVYLECVKR